MELVKGPQGTLYGRNASGGAINYLTTRPKLGEYEVSGSFEGGNYGNKGGEFAVNLPIGDIIAARISGTVEDKDGYTSERFGGDQHAAGRLKVLIQPSDAFSLLVNNSFGEINGNSSAGVVPLNRNIPGWYPWLDITDPERGATSHRPRQFQCQDSSRRPFPATLIRNSNSTTHLLNLTGMWELGH